MFLSITNRHSVVTIACLILTMTTVSAGLRNVGGFWFEPTTPKPTTSTGSELNSNEIVNRVQGQQTNRTTINDILASRLVKWTTGTAATVAIILNVFVIFLMYKKRLPKKDHRTVYYIFMSIGALCFAVSIATTTLSTVISDVNLFPQFGSCLMVQATALGSFHMIGISLTLLTLDLMCHVVSPVSLLQRARHTNKVTAGAMKCTGCYFFGLMTCYVPFFFLTEHPSIVNSCTLSAIYGYHVEKASELGIVAFVLIMLVIIIANGVLFKEIKRAQWRTKLRIRSELEHSQAPHEVLPDESASIRDSIKCTIAKPEGDNKSTCDTSFTEMKDPGPKPALQQLQRTPEDVIQQCTASIETPLKNETYRHDRQDYINGATELDEIVKSPRGEQLDGSVKSTLLEDSMATAEVHAVLETLDSFFVTPAPQESKMVCRKKKRKKHRNTMILSAACLPSERLNTTVEVSSSCEALIEIDTSLTLETDIRRASQGSNLVTQKSLCRVTSDSSEKASSYGLVQENAIPVETENPVDTESKKSSDESIKKTHIQFREMEIRKFLKSVRSEIIFSVAYCVCTLPSFLWNIIRISCRYSCPEEHYSSNQFYYIGMAILPLVNPIILLFTSKQLQNALRRALFCK